jgi:carboxymethylenebutenolidase
MGQWIKRILVGLLVLLAAMILILGGIILFDSLFGPKTSDITNTTFTTGDGQELLAYVAAPDGPGPHPGVLLLHEWWGLNEGITVLADALADEGYVVFAPDAYRGRVTSQIPRALWLRLTTPEEQVKDDLDAALMALRARPDVDTSRVASMGFCFGGGHSLMLGLRESENLALTILYYGDVITDANLLEPLMDSQGVLGVFAEEDQQIFVEDVLEFESALNTLDIPNEITIYPGVGHAFITEENFNEPGMAGEAWQQALDFLARNFQPETAQ